MAASGEVQIRSENIRALRQIGAGQVALVIKRPAETRYRNPASSAVFLEKIPPRIQAFLRADRNGGGNATAARSHRHRRPADARLAPAHFGFAGVRAGAFRRAWLRWGSSNPLRNQSAHCVKWHLS